MACLFYADFTIVIAVLQVEVEHLAATLHLI